MVSSYGISLHKISDFSLFIDDEKERIFLTTTSLVFLLFTTIQIISIIIRKSLILTLQLNQNDYF